MQKFKSWISYYAEEIGEILNTKKYDEVYIYDNTKFAVCCGEKAGEWLIKDIQWKNGYIAHLQCQYIISSEKLPIEYIAHIKL